MGSGVASGVTGVLVRRTWRRTWRSHLIVGAITLASTAAVMAAGRANVVDQPVVRWSELGLAGAAMVVATALLAVPAAFAAWRQRPAAALRSE